MKVEIGTNESGQRLDKFLRKWMKDVPLSAIYRNIRKGDIKVNGKKAKEKYSLIEGDIVEARELTSEGKKSDFQRIDNDLKVIYEDENILVVEKWPGVLVHSDFHKDSITLTDYVLSYLFDKGEYDPKKEITFTPSPCNRLDRNTSGLVIYGKNYESLKLLNEMIRDRRIKKYYFALVKNKIKDRTYEAFISKNEDSNISSVSNLEGPDTKEISMNVETIQTCGTFSLIELELITGRSHQLRAHLSYLGNSIIGDNKYGDKKINSFFYNKYGLDYQYLYAYKLVFKDCEGKLEYMNNKTITGSQPPIFKKIRNDVFKF